MSVSRRERLLLLAILPALGLLAWSTGRLRLPEGPLREAMDLTNLRQEVAGLRLQARLVRADARPISQPMSAGDTSGQLYTGATPQEVGLKAAQDLETTAASCGVRLTSLAYDPTFTGEGPSALGLTCTAEGSSSSVLSLVNGLLSGPKTLSIDEITLSAQRETGTMLATVRVKSYSGGDKR